MDVGKPSARLDEGGAVARAIEFIRLADRALELIDSMPQFPQS
jgi:hypothetical protein